MKNEIRNSSKNAFEQFGVDDLLAMDTGHGPDRRLDRSAARWRWYWRVWWSFPVAILLLWVLALYPAIWTLYLRRHVEFLWGALAGSSATAVVWIACAWRRGYPPAPARKWWEKKWR